MDRLEIFRSIAAQASRGELSFPSNVSGAIRFKQALDHPDVQLADAARLILADPLLSARTVAMANSAAYNRSGMEITNVTTAVMRLGLTTLRTLTAAWIVRQMSGVPADPTIRQQASQLWQHTARVAALAHVIAKRLTKLAPDTALFAGIVHEVGGFYLLSRSDDFPGLLDGALEGWVEYGEKVIGRSVLKGLGIPDTICAAIEQVWLGVGAQPPVSLGDVLVLANALATTTSPLQPAADAAMHEGDLRIDFAVGDDMLSTILQDAAEEIESIGMVLTG